MGIEPAPAQRSGQTHTQVPLDWTRPYQSSGHGLAPVRRHPVPRSGSGKNVCRFAGFSSFHLPLPDSNRYALPPQQHCQLCYLTACVVLTSIRTKHLPFRGRMNRTCCRTNVLDKERRHLALPPMPESQRIKNGAPNGNRTHVLSLEG